MQKILGVSGRTVIIAVVASLSPLFAHGASTVPADLQGLLVAQDPIVLNLDVAKHVFHEGEPILVQVTALNRSSQVVDVLQNTPWEAANITVAQGSATIAPSSLGSGVRNRNPIFAELHPGQQWIYQTYSDPEHYYALSNWGYQELPPGHYTIYASPEIISAVVRMGPWMQMHKQNRSNAVEIEILP